MRIITLLIIIFTLAGCGEPAITDDIRQVQQEKQDLLELIDAEK